MSQTLWLISEDKSGAIIFRHILMTKYPDLRVEIRWPSGKASISRLAQQLPTLIKDARRHKPLPKCIVVLHDFDGLEQNRKPYDLIQEICQQETLIELIAKDEIEAWLLADNGICKWLKRKAKNRDSINDPKRELGNWLKKQSKANVYNENSLRRILEWVDGSGDQYSASLRLALE